MVESQRALRAQKEGSRHKQQWLIGESDDHARRRLEAQLWDGDEAPAKRPDYGRGRDDFRPPSLLVGASSETLGPDL